MCGTQPTTQVISSATQTASWNNPFHGIMAGVGEICTRLEDSDYNTQSYITSTDKSPASCSKTITSNTEKRPHILNVKSKIYFYSRKYIHLFIHLCQNTLHSSVCSISPTAILSAHFSLYLILFHLFHFTFVSSGKTATLGPEKVYLCILSKLISYCSKLYPCDLQMEKLNPCTSCTLTCCYAEVCLSIIYLLGPLIFYTCTNFEK